MAKRRSSVALAIRGADTDRNGTSDNPAGVDPIIAEARRRWKKASEAEDGQRKSIIEAKKFRAGDQWPDAIKIQRQGSSSLQGVAAQPARPCLTIDRLSQPVRQVSNLIKAANFAIDVLPNGHGADTETADIFKGYLRRLQNAARGESPVEWAADGAVEGGIGWFRIRTDYVHEVWDGDPTDTAQFDQELRLERITNNLTVYCDPSALKPTRSDALYMIVTEDLDKDEFKSRWPEFDVKGLEDFTAAGDMGDWCDKDTIRIAEYWRVRFEDKTLTVGEQSRVMRIPRVEGFRITATEVLDRWTWVGSKIPLIPILGEEMNVDGKPVLRGLITAGMDAQRMVNYTYSGAMETFALAPKSPFVAAAGQINPYIGIWQTANTANHSYLPYEPVAIGGQALPPPQRQQAEAPIQAAVALMSYSEEAIKATTGFYASGLGDTTSKAVSGRAKQAEIQQSEIGSAHFPDNVKRALIYAGEQMVEIIPKITRKGQILQIIGVDDKPEQVMVGQPFQPDERGNPVPVDADPEQVKLEQGLAKFFDFTGGRYSVTVDVGKATATKREEGAAALGELIPHLPPEQQAVASPEYVKQLSFTGAQKIAEKLEKTLPPHLRDGEEGKPSAEVEALQQENQQLKQMIESGVAEEQAKQQAVAQREMTKADLDARLTIAKADLDNQTKLRLAEMNNATSLRVAEINAATKGYLAEAQHAAQHEQQALNLSDQQAARAEQAHESENQRAHEQNLADQQAAQASAQQAAEMASQNGGSDA